MSCSSYKFEDRSCVGSERKDTCHTYTAVKDQYDKAEALRQEQIKEGVEAVKKYEDEEMVDLFAWMTDAEEVQDTREQDQAEDDLEVIRMYT